MVHPVPSDARFRVLVESVTDYAIFLLDPDGLITSWNRGARALKQYTAKEVIGRHFSIFYPQEAIERAWPQEELRRAQELGRFEDEGWRLRKDGTRFWANVIITTLRNEEGQVVGYAKVTRDLSERQQQEDALRQSEERFRLLIEGVRDYAIFMLDPSGVIESWNRGAEVIKGYPATEAIGEHFSLFYTAEAVKAGEPDAALARARELGRFEQEGWRVRKDGTLFWANVVISAVRDEQGRLRGFAKVTRDMTERRRLMELESSSKRLTEFLAMLAHELRNPIAPIRNALTIMQLEPTPSPSVRSSRDVIDRQLTHLTRLVDDLLDAGRMTTGKIRLRKERVEYNQVVANAVEAARPLMDSRHHALTIELPKQAMFVEADGTRLTQVLQNLLVNAAKYTPDQGAIAVAVRAEGNQLLTTVKDTGIGLAPDALEHIFLLFAQGAGAGRETGLGIGLTLARSIVELHGGALWARSEGPGQGSTFTFSLPGVELVARDEAPHEGALRCLVVDDNRDAADTMAELSRLLGYSVRTAYSGADAVKLASDFEPEVALVDLGMPGMSGFELLSALRARPGGEKLKAAALTGYGNDEDKQRTWGAGFDAHLTKPVDLDVLQRFFEAARAALRP